MRTNTPHWQSWITFFLLALQQQKRALAVKVEQEKIVLAAMPALALKIVDYTKSHGRVTIGEMVKISGANRNTLKEHFRNLVRKNNLLQPGTGKGTWYSIP